MSALGKVPGGSEAIVESLYSVTKTQLQQGNQSNEILVARTTIDWHSGPSVMGLTKYSVNNYIIVGAVILKLIPTILLWLQNSVLALKILNRMGPPKHLFWH